MIKENSSKTTSSTIKLAVIVACGLSVSACEFFDNNKTVEVQTDNNNVITRTNDLVDSLPEGLQGDVENARHTSERLRNNDEE